MVGQVFKVVFSAQAVRRLNQVTIYLEEATSRVVARKVRNSILHAAGNLKSLPESKPILPDTEDLPFKVRYTKSYSYKLIFRIEVTSNTVRILNISHDAEDPDPIISGL